MFNLQVLKSYHYIGRELLLIQLKFSEVHLSESLAIVNLLKGIYIRNLVQGQCLHYEDKRGNRFYIENKDEFSISYMPFYIQLSDEYMHPEKDNKRFVAAYIPTDKN